MCVASSLFFVRKNARSCKRVSSSASAWICLAQSVWGGLEEGLSFVCFPLLLSRTAPAAVVADLAAQACFSGLIVWYLLSVCGLLGCLLRKVGEMRESLVSVFLRQQQQHNWRAMSVLIDSCVVFFGGCSPWELGSVCLCVCVCEKVLPWTTETVRQRKRKLCFLGSFGSILSVGSVLVYFSTVCCCCRFLPSPSRALLTRSPFSFFVLAGSLRGIAHSHTRKRNMIEQKEQTMLSSPPMKGRKKCERESSEQVPHTEAK